MLKKMCDLISSTQNINVPTIHSAQRKTALIAFPCYSFLDPKNKQKQQTISNANMLLKFFVVFFFSFGPSTRCAFKQIQ